MMAIIATGPRDKQDASTRCHNGQETTPAGDGFIPESRSSHASIDGQPQFQEMWKVSLVTLIPFPPL
jgi:hypothetical protein